jgi:hypothetical protein
MGKLIKLSELINLMMISNTVAQYSLNWQLFKPVSFWEVTLFLVSFDVLYLITLYFNVMEVFMSYLFVHT